MASEIRRLHPLSWLFITAISVKSLILPAIIVMFASSANPLARFELRVLPHGFEFRSTDVCADGAV